MTLGNPGIELSAEMELEKVRMEFELTRLRYLHQENERQRQHEEVMEQLQQQARPRLVSDMKVGIFAGLTRWPGADSRGEGASIPEAHPTCFRATSCPGSRAGSSLL